MLIFFVVKVKYQQQQNYIGAARLASTNMLYRKISLEFVIRIASAQAARSSLALAAADVVARNARFLDYVYHHRKKGIIFRQQQQKTKPANLPIQAPTYK